MTTEADIREKFWKHLKSERTIMIGLDVAITCSPASVATSVPTMTAP